MISLNNINITD